MRRAHKFYTQFSVGAQFMFNDDYVYDDDSIFISLFIHSRAAQKSNVAMRCFRLKIRDVLRTDH